jgi:hypothetical protein
MDCAQVELSFFLLALPIPSIRIALTEKLDEHLLLGIRRVRLEWLLLYFILGTCLLRSVGGTGRGCWDRPQKALDGNAGQGRLVGAKLHA